MSLVLIRYIHLANAGVQPDSLPSTAPATMVPPATANIEVIATSLILV